MVRFPFLFIAGAAPLDFLNTEVMLDGQPADLMESGDDLLHWLAESGLATKAEIREMRAGSPSPLASWLKASLQLRAGLRASFARLADGHSLRDADLRPINDVLASTTGTLQLRRSASHPSLQFQPLAITPPLLIARATAEFLATANLTRIRQCKGEGCILFFHDSTKSHTRRWCSMAVCGNRTKVKAHYVRKRSAERTRRHR